jgi:polyisoprenoid-binding protein YceI
MVNLPGRPSTKRGWILAIAASLVVFAAVAFVVVYFVLFPTSSPKPFSLTSSTAVPSSTAVTSSTASTPTTSTASSAASSQITGHWKVASGSEAGYRVREKLGFLPAQSDAVGRTSAITGDATFTESSGVVSVTAASFTVDVNTLNSDRSQRDEKIHAIGLESDRYSTATFVLSAPLKLPASASTGHVVHVAVTGVFNIHGTSKSETLPLEMRVSSSAIEAVGSLTFPWSEFNMTAPSIGGFVNVTEKATMEVDLHLQRA